MSISIKLLVQSEWELAYPIMVQLRSQYTLESFKQSVAEQAEKVGYQIYAAYDNDTMVAVAGIRPLKTLARGEFIHVDDLVVDEKLRVKGVGKQLLKYIHNLAQDQGMSSVFLDARPEAKAFYDKLGYILHTSPSMKFLTR